MKRSVYFHLAFFLTVILIPAVLSADYLFPGSAAYQPLAFIEPLTPDGLFHSWTGEIVRAGPANLGASLDFLRNADNSEDWDEILAVTGSFRQGKNLLFGVTIPSIIRDPDFNESDLLDIRLFARKRLMQKPGGLGISGELSAILPSARENEDYYPFTLDSPVVGARLAFFGTAGEMRLGLNLGYQEYLQTESGDDSDLVYSTWLEKDLEGPWRLVAELYGSQHSHSGPPGDDKVSDNYVLLGVRRVHSERTNFGIAAGSGLGGDSVADIRVTALATVKFGSVKEESAAQKKVVEKKEKTVTKKTIAAPAPGTMVVVMIAEGVVSAETEKRITKVLQGQGLATGRDPNPGIRSTGRNILYYMPGMKERAVSISGALVEGGHLKDLKVEESKTRLPGGWMLLVLGGEK